MRSNIFKERKVLDLGRWNSVKENKIKELASNTCGLASNTCGLASNTCGLDSFLFWWTKKPLFFGMAQQMEWFT